MKTKLTSLLIGISILFTMNAGAQNVGESAPDFSLDLLGGGTFTLSDYSGNVVFIFFFGYNCPHCKSNGPNTQTGLYEKYKDNSDFVAVGVDTWDGNSSGVSSYKQTTGITYPLALKASALEDTYKTTYDRIIVIDKDGIIRYKSSAQATESVVSDASDVIADLLGEDGSGNDMMGDDDMDDGDTGDDVITGFEDEVAADDAEHFRLYPMPVSNQLTLESTYFTESDFTLKIYNTSGKLTFQKKVLQNKTGKINIPMDTQQQGVHFVQLSSPHRLIVEKFIINK